jgi:predicted RNase H-like nuclease
MSTQSIIGFDSAWANTVPGSICAQVFSDGVPTKFYAPQLVRFHEAAELIEHLTETSDYLLIGLDQPTLVPNYSGIRPVERVAGSIVSALKGGVQPANRSKAEMFGPSAPIWSFLDRLNARENPPAARAAQSGQYVIEVFPALALPALIPEIWSQRRAAKYNPQVRKSFQPADWLLVTEGIAAHLIQAGLTDAAAVATTLAAHPNPRKHDQDHIDALISMLIAWIWRNRPCEDSAVIGDGHHGYMVTPVSAETRHILQTSAMKRAVPFNAEWPNDVERTIDDTKIEPPILAPTKQRDSYTEKPIARDRSGKSCPVCGHIFSGKGWGGIDAHWKSQHEHIMPYHKAWPIIRQGGMPSATDSTN